MFMPIGREGGQYHERLCAGYGLGWFVEAYRGHYRVHHGGNIDGFSALVSFLPYDGIGTVILTNKSATPLPSIIASYVADRLLGLEPVDFNARARLAVDQADSAQVEAKEETPADRVKDTKPSHKLEAYVGRYEHPAYGVVHVTLDNKTLRVQLHDLESPLEHWHYDVFRATEPPLGGERQFLTFRTNTGGDVAELEAVVEPSLPPMVFTRLPDETLSAPEYLADFVGKYSLFTTTVTVAMQNDQLTMSVPGQPLYRLVPYKRNEFTLKDLAEYSIAFERDKDGNVTAAKFKQPNGVFTAERVEE
jgi:hypothetical protein